MNFLLKSVLILDKFSVHNEQRKNVLLNNGKIEAITDGEPPKFRTIDCAGYVLTPGWFDMRASFCDPGYEHKEDLNSGCRSAAAGGFTEVALMPNTRPVIQTKDAISYIRNVSSGYVTRIHPTAALTLSCKGKELTEILDLHAAGAIAFTDGENPIWHTDILLKALQYVQKFDGLVIDRPEDKLLTAFGSMNEGITSTRQGLKGMPTLAEELNIERNLSILEYTGGKIHFSAISSGGSVELIKRAKEKGLQVTCDVSAYQLLFEDKKISDFDTNFKVNPPLRTSIDIEALKHGIRDGVIDAIVSSHIPQDEESKKLEFDLAEFGMIGLQTVLPIFKKIEKDLPLSLLIEKLTNGPRDVLGMENPTIEEGQSINLTLFDPEEEWIYDETTNQSKSRNSPLFGEKLTGKVKGVFLEEKAEIETGIDR